MKMKIDWGKLKVQFIPETKKERDNLFSLWEQDGVIFDCLSFTIGEKGNKIVDALICDIGDDSVKRSK